MEQRQIQVVTFARLTVSEQNDSMLVIGNARCLVLSQYGFERPGD